jgi:HEAT repeat protein
VRSLLLALLIGLAHAVPGGIRPVTATTAQRPLTVEELARDLDDSDRPTRLLAARELKRRVRMAVNASGRPGSIAELESRAELAAITRAALPACSAALQEAALVPACADVLGRLEEPGACAPLRAARTTASGRGARAIDKALGRLGAICPAEAE